MFDDLEALSISLSERSKETFWLGADVTPRCKLEHLAKSVFLQCTSSMSHVSSADKSHQKGELKHGAESLGCEWWVQVKELRESDSVNDGTIVVVGGDELNHGQGHGHSHNHEHSQSSCCVGEGSSNLHPSPLGISSGHSHSHSHSHDHGHSSRGNDGIDLTENKEKNKGKGRKGSASKIVGSSSEDVKHDHDLNLQGISHNYGHDDDDDDECSDINAGGGIGLHYDKDEEVAEYFGVGVFPQISTVTYLSVTPTAAPTVVIENTPNEPVGKEIKKCYVSYPVRGKHVRFDGRYLHGACPQFIVSPDGHSDMDTETETETDTAEGHSADLKSLNIDKLTVSKILNENSKSKSSETVKNDISKKYRVTFLANIWYGHKPSKIEILPTSICDALLKIENELDTTSAAATTTAAATDAAVCVFTTDLIAVPNTQICVLKVTKKTVEKEEYGFWQDIPFVTAESDWGKKEDETDLFLRIWTPSGTYLRNNKNKMGDEKIVKKSKTGAGAGAGSRGGSSGPGTKKQGKEKSKEKVKDVEKEEEKEEESIEAAVSTFEICYMDEESAACLLYDDDGDSGVDSEGEGEGEEEGEGVGEGEGEVVVDIGRASTSADRDDDLDENHKTWHDKASVRK